MKLRSLLVIGLSAWLLCQGQVFAQTAKDALKLVPQDAVGVLIVNRLGETDVKIKALGNRLQAPLPASPLEIVKGIPALGGLKGLDEKGSVVVAVLPAADGAVAPVAYVPVSDYQQFLQPFNPVVAGEVSKVQLGNTQVLAAKKGAFAILTEAKYEQALKKALQTTKGLGETMVPLQTFVTDNDIAGILTPAGVKFVVAQGREGVAKVKGQVENNPQQGTKFVLDFFDSFGDFLKAAESSVTHAALGTRIDKAGNLELDLRVLFAEGSAFARNAGQVQPLKQDPLNTLPGGPFVLAFSGALSEAWMQALMDFNTRALGSAAGEKASPEKLKELEKAYRLMVKGTRGMAMVMGVPKGQEPLLGNTTGLIRVEDSATYFTDYVKSLKTINELSKDLGLQFTYKAEVKKVGGLSGVEVLTEVGADNQAAQAQQKFMEALFGHNGKIVASMVAVDKHTILTRYTSLEKAKDAVQAYQSKQGGLAKEPEVAKTAALLPQGSQWVFYLSPSGTIEAVTQVLAALGQAGAVQLPDFPSTPPVGGALKLSAAGLEGRLVMPATVLDGVGAYTQKLRR